MLGTHLMDVAVGSAVLEVVGTVLLVGGGVVALAAGVAVAAVAVTVRRIRRNPALTTASLRVRSITESGPRREVARLRLQLHRSVESGRAAIGAADATTGLPGETPALFRRIEREAMTVEQHLRVLQVEHDDAALRAALPALRRRVDELADLVQRLRAAVAEGLAAASEGSMSELGADVEREVIALRAGRERLRDLTGPAERAPLAEPTDRPRLTGEGTRR